MTCSERHKYLCREVPYTSVFHHGHVDLWSEMVEITIHTILNIVQWLKIPKDLEILNVHHTLLLNWRRLIGESQG